jgi:hypothetical protein
MTLAAPVWVKSGTLLRGRRLLLRWRFGRSLVAFFLALDLLLCAKHLFVAAMEAINEWGGDSNGRRRLKELQCRLPVRREATIVAAIVHGVGGNEATQRKRA